jgi:hypothetical protein
LETAMAADASVKIADIVRQMVDQLSNYLDETVIRSEAYDPSHFSNALVHTNESGEIDLLFHAKTPIGEAEEQELERLGARIVARVEIAEGLPLPPAYMVQAWVPYDQVETAAALPWVVAVTPPDYGHVDPHPTNPINSEGVGLHNANQAHNRGVNGAGVTIGVVSDGVSNLAAAQAQNELPAVTVLAAGTGDEGTAMLEIVHDMAPGAALMFQATGGGVVNHVNALTNLRNNGANVMAEDIAFDAQPAFQQGLAAATAEAIAAAGVSVHSSAGNLGNNHAARVQAVGTGGGPDGVTFAAAPPGCANNPDNVVAIAPGGDTTFDVILGQAGVGATSITLQWSEPRAIFPTAGQGGFTDLNLYVMDAALTQCLAQSVGVQANGVGDTIEQISIDMPGTAAKIVVDVQGTSSAVAPPVLDLRWRNMQAEIDATTRTGSLNPDSNYTGLATAAAAVNGTTGAIEPFSSGGPVQLGLTTICPGNAAGPCTGVAGPGITTTNGRPNWAAADGVSVSGVGGFGSGICPAVNPGDCRFFGTSASAPHAAGCDALVRDGIGVPASPVAPVNNRLALTATDIAPASVDNITGAGLLNCFAAVGFPVARCRNRTVLTHPGTCTANASIDAGSFDPNNDPITLTQAPPGPYGLGSRQVTLSVTETGPGALSDSCQATVTVVGVFCPKH